MADAIRHARVIRARSPFDRQETTIPARSTNFVRA
jgi:hypothetical protein